MSRNVFDGTPEEEPKVIEEAELQGISLDKVAVPGQEITVVEEEENPPILFDDVHSHGDSLKWLKMLKKAQKDIYSDTRAEQIRLLEKRLEGR